MADCLFCKIARKEVPAKIVYDDRQVVAFEDIHPQAPTHTLVISKSHFATLNDVGAEQEGLLGHMMLVAARDRKSTRLNSSHGYISYAVFCLKKKKKPALLMMMSTRPQASIAVCTIESRPAVAA